ncbi:hypothetical protein THIOM_001127 [Candidatus Thiomargarita nelsonii]|uniref:Uncharacterized protein n=1 Tax=Candidatus Thiomargarita nelsonii TaxID=1003181 RepID=A0A176S512_9GAMM|nr:hypothetical protein THIOM_001127 [Candidatus Thiomargarita nelsonii]
MTEQVHSATLPSISYNPKPLGLNWATGAVTAYLSSQFCTSLMPCVWASFLSAILA